MGVFNCESPLGHLHGLQDVYSHLRLQGELGRLSVGIDVQGHAVSRHAEGIQSKRLAVQTLNGNRWTTRVFFVPVQPEPGRSPTELTHYPALDRQNHILVVRIIRKQVYFLLHGPDVGETIGHIESARLSGRQIEALLGIDNLAVFAQLDHRAATALHAGDSQRSLPLILELKKPLGLGRGGDIAKITQDALHHDLPPCSGCRPGRRLDGLHLDARLSGKDFNRRHCRRCGIQLVRFNGPGRRLAAQKGQDDEQPTDSPSQ